MDLAKPTDEFRRVLQTAIPLSIGATSEAVFRLVTASFISQYLGAESMIAYLLVMLFVRLTSEELSGAIVDALSSFLEASLFSNEGKAAFVSGQYTQTAIILQLILGIPLLATWAMSMNTVVAWLVQSPSIAAIAGEYTKVAVFGYVFQSISRSFTAAFHICGHEHFESVIDFVASSLQMVAIACVVALKMNSSLTTVAHIQVLVGLCACVAKVGYPIFKGWERPFRDGLIRNSALIQVRGERNALFAYFGYQYLHYRCLVESYHDLVFASGYIPAPDWNSARIWRVGSTDNSLEIRWSC